MELSPPKSIKRNFKEIRAVRQDNNNKTVYEILTKNETLTKNDQKNLYKNINCKEYKRTLADLELTEAEFILKCKDPFFAKITARHISKNATRQGSKDETEQLRTCNITAEKCGIFIKNLTATELRPTKDGLIVSKKEMTMKKIKKDCCLKSFDGEISGKLNGFVAAKVAYGSGGHQDNVFEEIDAYGSWWKTYKSQTEATLIILIDTDLMTKFTRLKEKYESEKNVMVFNHVQFQQYMIDTYYTNDSM
jgi:hypothetical protein